MKIHIELPSDLEHELSTEASQLKLPLSEYILHLLSFRLLLQNPPTTGADLVTYWERIGAINSRPDITESQEHARQVRNRAEHREKPECT